MDDHTLIVSSIWEFLNPQHFIERFREKAGALVSTCEWDPINLMFAVGCRFQDRDEVKRLVTKAVREYVDEQKRAALHGEVPFDEEALVREISSEPAARESFWEQVDRIYEKRLAQREQAQEPLIETNIPHEVWTPSLPGQVADEVFTKPLLREISKLSGCELVRGAADIIIRIPENADLQAAYARLDTVNETFANCISTRVEFDLCFDEGDGGDEFRFMLPRKTMDATLAQVQNFFSDAQVLAVGEWDASSKQYRVLQRTETMIALAADTTSPWEPFLGFVHPKQPDPLDDWCTCGTGDLGRIEHWVVDASQKAEAPESDPMINTLDEPPSILDEPVPEDSSESIPHHPAPLRTQTGGVSSRKSAAKIPGPSQPTKHCPTPQRVNNSAESEQLISQDESPTVPPSFEERFRNRTRRPEIVAGEWRLALQETEEQNGEIVPMSQSMASMLSAQVNRQPPNGYHYPPLTDRRAPDHSAGNHQKFHHERKLQKRSKARAARADRSVVSADPSGSSKLIPPPYASSSAAPTTILKNMLNATPDTVLRIVTLSLARHPCTAVFIEHYIGKLYVNAATVPPHLRCKPKQPATFFRRAEWPTIFGTSKDGPDEPISGSTESVFSRRLTSRWQDARYLLDLKAQDTDSKEVYSLFDEETYKQRDFYRIQCSYMDQSEAVIEIDKSATAKKRSAKGKEVVRPNADGPARDDFPASAELESVRAPTNIRLNFPPVELGRVHVHAPWRTWDSALQVTGSRLPEPKALEPFQPVYHSARVVPADPGFVPEGAPPPAAAAQRQPDGLPPRPARLYTHTHYDGVAVEHVELRRERHHRVQGDRDIALVLTEVQRLAMEAHDGDSKAVCAWPPPDDETMQHGGRWFEARVESRALRRALTNAAAHGPLEPAQLLAQCADIKAAVAKLLQYGTFVLSHCDDVGTGGDWFTPARVGVTDPSRMGYSTVAPGAQSEAPPPTVTPTRTPTRMPMKAPTKTPTKTPKRAEPIDLLQ